MGFGPIGYFENGTFIPFEKLDYLQKSAYEHKASDIMNQLRTPREANDTVLRQYLLQAGALGMLYTPDGKAVSQADVAKASENPETMFGLLADLIVVKPDIDHPNKNEYRSLQAMNRNVSVDWRDADGLTANQLREKQRTYLEKKQFTAQTEKISAMSEPDRAKYLEDVKTTLAKWSADGIEVGSPALKELLENAVEMGIVREVSGSTLTKETAAKFAERPAYLKNLVFIQPLKTKVNDFDTYRLDVSDGNPQTVKMHPEKLASADIIQMDKDMQARGTRKDAVEIYVEALGDKNEAKIADCEKRLKEFGYKVNHLDGLPAFSLADEKQVYFYGNPKPITAPEDYIKAVRHNEAPKAPNKWGIFEGLRSFWHNHISKLPDYEDYERERGLYELDKYRLAEKAGLDVSGIADKAKEYEQKYGNEYDTYCRHQEVETWARNFNKRPMNADEKAFINDFKAAMKQYPDIAAQIMKDAPNVSKDMLEELVFAAQPYAELSQAGDFSKKTLGVLSALGVAAECDLFSSELKEQIFGLCKALNKDFGSAHGAEFLTDEQEKTITSDMTKKEQAAQLEAWTRDFNKRPMNADEKAFINDFKAAMKQYPDIAAQIMKDAPNVSKDMLEELVFAAQPYAELSQAGDFSKKTLGVLSALGVAAECDLFSSELKEQIFGLCKARNKDFGSAHGAEFLTDEQEKQAVADLEPDKNEPEVVGGSENGVADLNDEYIEEMENALRAMTEEQKRILADKIDGLTEGEKNTLEKLAKNYGFDINNLDLNKTVSETVDEKTMDLPQINV